MSRVNLSLLLLAAVTAVGAAVPGRTPVASVAAAAPHAAAAPARAHVAAASAPTRAAPVGPRLMVAMRGTRPSPALLARIRRGEVGGIILFGSNITSRAQIRALTAELQDAARSGGRPPLLIATDQEGGRVRRL